jgi:hypothetical protein
MGNFNIWERTDMGALTAWGPVIVTLLGWIFFGGVFWQKVQQHDKDLAEHQERQEDLTTRVNEQAVNIGKLQAWKDGYGTAREIYGHGGHTAGD